MFARKIAVAAIFLMAVPSAYADFSAELWFGDVNEDPLPSLLPELTNISVYVYDTQIYGTAGEGKNFLSNIQLNWEDSAHNPAVGGDPFTAYIKSLGAAAGEGNLGWWWETDVSDNLQDDIKDAIAADGVVHRNSAQHGWQPSSPIKVGALTFQTPAYDGGGANDYVISLGGGEVNPPIASITWVTAGLNMADLTLHDYEFTVTPEPATISLLALGGAVALIGRKRRR